MGDSMTPIEPNTNPALLVAQVHRWRTAFLGMVVLLAGVAIGIGLSVYYGWRFAHDPAFPLTSWFLMKSGESPIIRRQNERPDNSFRLC